MDLCYAGSEISRVTNYKKLQTCNRCRKPGLYAYECRPLTRFHVPHKTVAVKRPRTDQGVSPTLLRERNAVTDTGTVGAEHLTDLSTSSEFAGLLTRIAPNMLSLCVTVSGNEVYLITLKLEVKRTCLYRP